MCGSGIRSSELQAAQEPDARFFFLTTKSERAYYDVAFARAISGFRPRNQRPAGELARGAYRRRLLTIPMHGTRSLNLATAVAIVLFEAMRQQRVA